MIFVKVLVLLVNFGVGFDCMGVVLKFYNIIEVEEIEKGFIIILFLDDLLIVKDENNFVFKVMKMVFDEVGWYLRGFRINFINEIFLMCGFGFFVVCILGGIYVVNLFSGGKFFEEEMIYLVVKMEGYLDNLILVMIGGFVFVVLEDKKVNYIKFVVLIRFKFVVFIFDF